MCSVPEWLCSVLVTGNKLINVYIKHIQLQIKKYLGPNVNIVRIVRISDMHACTTAKVRGETTWKAAVLFQGQFFYC